jgi:murein DD-endopeptidase MepM/ murein hydrolase activator NlpD
MWGKWGRNLFVAAWVLGAMAASAAAGAWAQSYYSRLTSVSVAQQRAVGKQVARDSAFVRENVNVLASRVGDFQATLIAMNGLGKRVAEAAGVSYTDPEIHASLEQTALPTMDRVADEQGERLSIEDLERRIDWLGQRIARQKDTFAMLDLALAKRVGIEASLPTFTPVRHFSVGSSFGRRRNPVTGRTTMHEGIDFTAPKGTRVHAASGGIVAQAGYRKGYGKMIDIDHGNGLVTRYAHASILKAKPGDLIEKGQEIARVGSTGRSTGSHLHFEVRMAGRPLDPALFLSKAEPWGEQLVDASSRAKAILPQVR